MNTDPTIAFVATYFGRWPIWFPAFLKSCEYNPTIDWILITDCEYEGAVPANVHMHRSSLMQVQVLVSEKLGFNVPMENPRKLCDLKPLYGLMFEDLLVSHDFWGFCDIDVIWGNIRKFWGWRLLAENDIITTRRSQIAGHMCLLKNNGEIRRICTGHPDFREIMLDSDYRVFDENAFSDYLHTLISAGSVKVHWPAHTINFAKSVDSQPSVLSPLDAFRWTDGALHSLKEGAKEILYLHFMNWKSTMKHVDMPLPHESACFDIRFSSIHARQRRPPWRYRLGSRIKSFKRYKLYVMYFYRKIKKIRK